jgi:predicted dithiol-disulfide oxidoreductase (DUF899 family)
VSGPNQLPNESREYREARDELLAAELEARRAVERAAELRRRLPAGGAVPEDYMFQEATPDGTVTSVRLSELFESGLDTLILYSFMFSPEMPAPCTACSSILDSLDGAAVHVRQRAGLAVVAKSPIDRILRVAAERGWGRLRFVSSHGTTYNRDYLGETTGGDQRHRLNVFLRDGDAIRHHWCSEDLPADPGQEPRITDLIWPLWHLLDLTPAGRGHDPDFPALSYPSSR